MSPRRALLVALLILASAKPSQAQCARDGQALTPATDLVSPKDLERTVRKMLGPPVASIVRKAPWRDLWVGNAFDLAQPSFFIQAFEKDVVLPPLRFPIAAPKPFTITLELDIDARRDCIAVELSSESTADDGALTVRAPMTASVTISVGGLSERVSLPASEAMLRWQRDGRQLEADLLVAGLELGLTTPALTLDEIRRLTVAKHLLVRSLERPGSHRIAAIAMLRDLGFQHLPGDSWIQLRQLQAKNKLTNKELATLDWLARRPVYISGTEVATFTSQASRAAPRVFVAGEEITGWTRQGDTNELRVGMTGLSAVRVEFSDGSVQSFITVLDRDVRIRLLNIWGATLETAAAGPRCGVVRDNAAAACGQDAPDTPFNLQHCGGAAAEGSVVVFGVSLLPSLPGLYVQDRNGLHFDPDGACSPK